MAKSYMTFSLNKKVEVTEAKEKDKLLVCELIMWFKCGKTQVYDTLNKRINNE
jgi:hypothetical protein